MKKTKKVEGVEVGRTDPWRWQAGPPIRPKTTSLSYALKNNSYIVLNTYRYLRKQFLYILDRYLDIQNAYLENVSTCWIFYIFVKKYIFGS